MIRIGGAEKLSRSWMPIALAHLVLSLWLIPHASFDKYPKFAELLREGQLTSVYAASPSPLYLLLNVLFPPVVLRIIQTCAGIFVLRTLFVTVKESRGLALAWIATGVLAFSRPFLIYETILEPDFLLMAFLFIGACLMLRRESTRRSMVLAMSLLGGAVSLRPLVLPAVAVIVATCWLRRRRTTLVAGALFCVLAFAPALTVSLLARSSIGNLRSTMSGGTVLYEGSRPEGFGDGAEPPYVLKSLETQLLAKQDLPDYAHELYRRFAGASGSDQEYWISFWAAFARTHPAAFMRLQLRKLGFTLAGSNNIDVRPARRLDFEWGASPLPVPGQWILRAGLVGFLLFLVIGSALSPLAWVWMAQVFSIAVFYPSERYLLALLPFAALFGASFACFPFDRKIWSRKALAAAVAGVLALVLLLSSEPVRESGRFSERLMAASRLWGPITENVASGNRKAALAKWVEAQADFPFGEYEADFRFLPFESPELAARSAKLGFERWGSKDPLDRVFLAQLDEWAGNCEEVESLARGLKDISIIPGYYDLGFDPRLMAARCRLSRRAEPATLTKSSDPKGALEWAKASLDSVPGNREALALSYALVFHKDERRAGEFRSELFRLHEPVSAELSLAESFRLTGNLPEADAAIERALARVPESGLLNFEKALIAADRGLGLDAVRSFNKALTLFPVHNFRVTALDPVFSGLVAKEPGDPEIAAARIRELARSGRIDEADELALRWVNKGRAPTDIQEMAAALGRLKSGVASDAPADQNHSR